MINKSFTKAEFKSKSIIFLYQNSLALSVIIIAFLSLKKICPGSSFGVKKITGKKQ